MTGTQPPEHSSVPENAKPLVPNVLAPYFPEAPASWLKVLISAERSRLSDVVEGDLHRLTAAQRDELEELIKRRVSQVVTRDEIRLPEIPSIMIAHAVASSANRTKNAMLRLYGQKAFLQGTARVTSVRELLTARNLGVACALDFLRQLDRLPDYEDLIAEQSKLLQPEQCPVDERPAPLAPTGIPLPSPAISLLQMLTLKELRNAKVVIQRMFRDDAPTPTLQELAIARGVTRERVRQIEFMQTRKIRQTLELARYRPLRAAIEGIRNRAGTVTSCEFGSLVVHDALTVPSGHVLPEDVLIFALFLAGYCERDTRWIYHGTRAAVIANIDEVMVANADGSKSLEIVIKIAAQTCAVPEAFVREAIAEYNVTIIAELLFPRLLNVQDRIDAVFRVANKPMTLDEIAERIGQDGAAKTSLQNQLGSDPRFYKVSVTDYALAEWGLRKYTTITNAIREEIDEQGGGVSLAFLMRELPRRFGVSATSVQMYAGQSPFFVDTYGIVKIAESDRTMSRRELRPPQHVRNLFRLYGVWHLRIQVTSEMLRGVGITTSILAADLAGVKQGDVALKRIDDFEVSFRWTSQQPYISSIRYFLEISSLSIGDYVFLSLSPQTVMRAFATKLRIVKFSHGLSRLAALSGVLDDNGEEPLQRIAVAVGLDKADANLAAVREVFLARRDQDALELLPGSEDRVDYDPLDDLMALLE